MAEKRMISRDLLESDDFMELSHAAQALYFQLLVRADDDGFLNSVKLAMKISNTNNDNLQELLANNYIIRFDSGVIAITHWNIHNNIRRDRYKATIYQEEKSQLVDNGKGYERQPNCGQLTTKPRTTDNQVTTNRQPSDNQPTTKQQPTDNQVTTNRQPSDNPVVAQISIDKIRLDKSRLEEYNACAREDGQAVSPSPSKKFKKPTIDEVRAYCLERNNKVDPEQFVDFYTSKGWKVGKEPMKDWKAAVRTWEKRDERKASPPAKVNKAPVGAQRTYDFAELERRLTR